MRNHDLVGYFDSEQGDLHNSAPAQLAHAELQHEQHFQTDRVGTKGIADRG
jgi:hypothetical protein